MSEIFDQTTRPNAELFFSRNDPNDPRLGEVVGREEKDYPASDIVILGCQQDEGVRRNNGRVGAAEAPDAIRAQFYRLTTFNFKKKVFDLGNVRLAGNIYTSVDTEVVDIVRVPPVSTVIVNLGKQIVPSSAPAAGAPPSEASPVLSGAQAVPADDARR